VFREPRQLADRVALAARPILDHLGLALETAHLAEGRERNAINFDEEVERLVWIVTLRRGHDPSASTSRPRILHHRREAIPAKLSIDTA
jgi:hypothetical protein